MKRIYGLISFIGLIFLFIFLVGYFLKKENQIKDKNILVGDMIKNKVRKPLVRVEKCLNDRLIEKIFATGLIRAKNEITVMAKVSGEIENIHVQNGEIVKKNDPLLSLNKKEITLDIEKQESKIQLIKQDLLIRFKELNKKFLINENNLISSWLKKQDSSLKKSLLENFNSTETAIMERLGYIEAVLNLAQLKLKEKDHTIYAAFSGRLSRFKLQVGDIITANTAILNLSSSKYLIAELGVIDSDIKRIELGTKAEFTFESTKVFGTVISISDQIEKESLLCRVDVLIENEKNIPNGKFIKMYIHSKKRPKQLLVPKEAVINRDQKEIIFIARDNKAIWCYVETGKSNNEYIEVLSNQMNLQEGEPIIVDGQFTLAHQSDIEIRNRIE